MANLPAGDLPDRAKEHRLSLLPVTADQRGRCYFITAFNSPKQPPIEPTFSSELLHILVYQQELTSGKENGGNQYVHLQIYCVFRSRHVASKCLRLLWPMAKNNSVYIAMAKKGTSHATALAYVQKPESRVPGCNPVLHGDLDEIVVKKEKPTTSNRDAMIAVIQSLPSAQAAFSHPLTRGYASTHANTVAKIWQERRETISPTVASLPLLGWQRAALHELQSTPTDKILWLDIQEDCLRQAIYFAKLVRNCAKERCQYVEASEPRQGILHKMTKQKDIVIVLQLHGDTNVHPTTLLWLKDGLTSASTVHGSDIQLSEHPPRHVLVLSVTAAPNSPKLRGHIKILSTDDTSTVEGVKTLPSGAFVTLATPEDIAGQEAEAEAAQHEPSHGNAARAHECSDTDVDDDSEDEDTGDRKRAKVEKVDVDV
jgi:hypothetical protein